MLPSNSDYASFKQSLRSSGCALCELSKNRTQIVVDRGEPSAKIFFVGEAPGEKEDLSGNAFVGRAGRLLDSMLMEQGFDTSTQAIIANVVKCRPPKNRAPKPEEAAACLPFLRHQIALVQPKVLVLLGATALKHLIPAKKELAMGDVVGRPFRDPAFPGMDIFVLYHPAFILRDPRKKPLMAEHLAALLRLTLLPKACIG